MGSITQYHTISIEPTVREYAPAGVFLSFCITQIVNQSATFSVCT